METVCVINGPSTDSRYTRENIPKTLCIEKDGCVVFKLDLQEYFNDNPDIDEVTSDDVYNMYMMIKLKLPNI